MRYAKLACALLGMSAALAAADPFVGTWKLNPSRSKYKTGQPPKEQMVTITESGSDQDVTIKGVAADGTPISSRYTVPTTGGVGKVIESPYEAVSGKRMGPNQREITYSKGSKVVLTVRTRVSSDGKTMTASVKGTDAQGKPVEATALFERQ